MTMSTYLNVCPNGYYGETDLLTIEVPVQYTDALLTYLRPIAEQKGIEEARLMKDVLKNSIIEIERKNYERKNRKTKKR